MLILLFVVFLGLTLLCAISYNFDEFVFIPGTLTVICVVAMLFVGMSVSNGRTIDQKLEMYAEENAIIESQINDVVARYMEYESTTFGELKNDDGINMISLYPELKSDALIMKQIETYTANNDKIKSLKESKINQTVYKWWLYFGK